MAARRPPGGFHGLRNLFLIVLALAAARAKPVDHPDIVVHITSSHDAAAPVAAEPAAAASNDSVAPMRDDAAAPTAGGDRAALTPAFLVPAERDGGVVTTSPHPEDAVVVTTRTDVAEEAVVSTTRSGAVEDLLVTTVNPGVFEEKVGSTTRLEVVENGIVTTSNPEVVEDAVVTTARPEAVDKAAVNTSRSEVVEDVVVTTTNPEDVEDGVVTTTSPVVVEEASAGAPASSERPEQEVVTSEPAATVSPTPDSLPVSAEPATREEPVAVEKAAESSNDGDAGKAAPADTVPAAGTTAENDKDTVDTRTPDAVAVTATPPPIKMEDVTFVVDEVTSAPPAATTSVSAATAFAPKVIDGLDEVVAAAGTSAPAEAEAPEGTTTRVVSVDGPLEGFQDLAGWTAAPTRDDIEAASGVTSGVTSAVTPVEVHSRAFSGESADQGVTADPVTAVVTTVTEPTTANVSVPRESSPPPAEAPVDKQDAEVTTPAARELDRPEMTTEATDLPGAAPLAEKMDAVVSKGSSTNPPEEQQQPESKASPGADGERAVSKDSDQTTTTTTTTTTPRAEETTTIGAGTVAVGEGRLGTEMSSSPEAIEATTAAAAGPSPTPMASSTSSQAAEDAVVTESTLTRGVTRGGAARPINEAATEAHVGSADDTEPRAVVSKATKSEAVSETRSPPASTGRSLGADGVVGTPDCPKDVMEADARFVIILVLLCALSVLGVSVVVLVMKFRVKPAARRSITMSMCWRLRRSRARRATITPPFAHHHHHHAGEVERGKGKEDYNLASDEDCRADEAVTAAAAAAAMQTTDMPTWTFCEKGSSAGPQCPQQQQQQQQSLERRRHQKQGQEEEQGKETEEEVQCSKM